MSALSGAFSEMSKDLAQTADPRRWMQTHPWITLASAAVAGFATAAVAVPSKEQQALKKLEAIERAIYGHRRTDPAVRAEHLHDGDGDSAAAKPHGGGILSRIISELIGALKPAIVSMITAGVTQAAQPSPQEMAEAARQTGAGQPPPSYQ